MAEDKFVKANPFEGTESREKSKPNLRHRETPAPKTEETPMVEETENNMDFLAELEDKKPESKAYSIYLDVDVVEAVDKIAKKRKTSRSKVINLLLRNMLNQ